MSVHQGVWVGRRVLGAAARRVIGTITHVSTQDGVAALTFDDGPHPDSTPHLLEVLEGHGARATFFMVGEAAQRYPELVQRVAQGGHAIGCHTWDHVSLPLISRRERRSQLRACARTVAPYGQRLLRPPYGHQNIASRLDALWLGYTVVAWSLHAYDWLDHDAEWMASRLVEGIKPGSVVLLHDVLYHWSEERYVDRRPMIKAVRMLLERTAGRMNFITVPELLRLGRPQRRNWYWEADPEWLNSLKGNQQEPRRYALSTEGR